MEEKEKKIVEMYELEKEMISLGLEFLMLKSKCDCEKLLKVADLIKSKQVMIDIYKENN